MNDVANNVDDEAVQCVVALGLGLGLGLGLVLVLGLASQLRRDNQPTELGSS